MNLFNKKMLAKPMISKQKETVSKKKKERILENTQPSTQAYLKYTSQFENGVMHIVEDEYSRMVKLGEINYEVATEEDQLMTVMSYAEALNTLDKNGRYQLFVHNKPLEDNFFEDTFLDYRGDSLDTYREEINQIIQNQYEKDAKNFVVEKYAIFSTKAKDVATANRSLNTTIKNFQNRFVNNGVDLPMETCDGIQRLRVMASILRPKRYFTTTYQDIVFSGLTSKAFIAPSHLRFPRNKPYFYLGDKFASILYIRQYPKYLEDRLIKELCQAGYEIMISIHARPYDMVQAKKMIKTKQVLNRLEVEKQIKQNFKEGLPEEYISGAVAEIKRSAQELMKEIKDNGQKLFSGIFSMIVISDTEQSLLEAVHDLEDVCHTWSVEPEIIEDRQEEALNTILPIGKPYLDVEMNYMRDMTTANVVTQIPFSNVELQSKAGQFYGRNQMTNNMITINRKKDLITPSGLILGTSGSGKSMATKWEMLSTFLRYPEDRMIVVDPESEYLVLARELGAQILDISTGTTHHLNILDLPDESLLDQEDRRVDLIKEKANLLSNLFESLLKEFTDEEASIIDRVTRKTYQIYNGQIPTLVDWYQVLSKETGSTAKHLALKVEPYTIGSQDIFAHATNVDLNSSLVVFNIKKLDERLKPFAMKVILDTIWKQIVESQGKRTTRLYFDELQLNFDTESNAQWFMALWSRVRKYGAIPTGITQNVSTLLDSSAGRKMISNSEFLILLRQKIGDITRLQEVIHLTPKLIKYINDRAPQGTGLISAGGITVPFENPIPKNTQLFIMMNTDA